MKALLVSFAVLASANTLSYRAQFAQWATTYNRTYSTKSEYETRLLNFRANLEQIEMLNRRHAGMPDGARFGVNKYADLSKAELRSLRGLKLTPDTPKMFGGAPLGVKDVPLADDVDWRMRNVVSPIQDQGMCGSCWAFSTTANIESQVAVKYGKPIVKLSEQQLVDCDHVCGQYRGFNGCDSGCDGGLQPNAFQYVQNNGQTTLESYPYTALDGTCPTQTPNSAVKVSGFNMLPQNETQIAQWVQQNGPVAIAVDASEWSFYFGGVMKDVCHGTTTFYDLDHAVNIVGYGSTGTDSYWIVRNSWATDWGESGYVRLARDKQLCGVQLFACTALV